MFRFVILGAAKIADKFCGAVKLIEGVQVVAVASKSLERARNFAEKNEILAYYDSYEQMLEKEKPDGAYIAVTVNDHYRLTMMCLERKIPVLCEKAMFNNSSEAKEAFALARKKKTFVMEATWSRFLPAIRKAKEWLKTGRIGYPEISQFTIGFRAPEGKDNRYLSPALGGGAAKDITIYAYEITTYLLEQKIQDIVVDVNWGDTGVDISEHVLLRMEHTLADLMSTFAARVEEKLILYGPTGKIMIPHPHYAEEAFLYNAEDELVEHFRDEQTENGFVYEIEEMLRCIGLGMVESMVVPHADTLACAELFDLIEATRKL